MLLMLRIKMQHKALVRTLHNVSPHERPSRCQRALIDWSERLTTVWITPSDASTAPSGAPCHVVPLGHYRDWFAPAGDVAAKPGRFVYFGHIRAYKGVEELLRAFGELRDESASLHVVGKIRDPDLAEKLSVAARAEPRVQIDARYVDDSRLYREVQEAEVVVLPFREVTNSSSVVLALSLRRPVLVPDLPAMREIAAEVGSGWVMTYSGEITAGTLEGALAAAREMSPSSFPDLAARDWDRIGEAHARAFAEAVRIAGCEAEPRGTSSAVD